MCVFYGSLFWRQPRGRGAALLFPRVAVSAVTPCAGKHVRRYRSGSRFPPHPRVGSASQCEPTTALPRPCGSSRVAASSLGLSTVSPAGRPLFCLEGWDLPPTEAVGSAQGQECAVWAACLEARPLSGGQTHVPAQAQERRQLVGHTGARGSPEPALAFGDLLWPVLTQSQKFCGLSKPYSNELFILSCWDAAQ